jgi:nicotinamidase/pyrazinamidase
VATEDARCEWLTMPEHHRRERDVLLVTDVQNDFLPGGALPVPHGNEIVPVINALGQRFVNVVLIQDWHPPGHVSFASSHAGRRPFERIRLDYGEQILWPDHCVQGTAGAAFSPRLRLPHAQLIVRKGHRPDVDSYSAFVAADRIHRTGLAGCLRERGIERVFMCGLATDFCVAWSAIDARDAGFEVAVIEDACRAIDTEGSLAAAWRALAAAGVARTTSGRIA